MNGLVLIDTSSWVEGLRRIGRDDIRARVDSLIRRGQAAWCEMVLLELWNGARGSEEKQRLRAFEQEITLLPTTSEVWELANRVARAARAAGHTVPPSDLLIFACANWHGVSLEHCDQHLATLEKLKF